MNVAGYVRVSSDAQTENYSIPMQKQMIEDYCRIKKWNLIKFYVDAGYTGANTDRPELQELLSEAKGYDLVLVYRLDRFSRSQKDMLNLIEILNKSDTKFSSIQEGFDTSTPIGMAMLGIMAAFAQLERETIKERMSLGRKGRTKKGLWRAGSNVPTGYDYIDGHLVVREDEAIQVRKIFELCLKGWTMTKIKTYMHEHYQNRYSSWAQASSVSMVLRNPLYIGQLPSKSDGCTYPGEHEPIIDEVTFKKVQQLLDARQDNFDRVYLHPFKAKHLLTGLAFCGECGGRISCTTSHKYSYYGCHKKDGDPRKRLLPKCSTPHYRVEVLDDIVIAEVLKLAFDEKAVKKLVKPAKNVKNHTKTIKNLENQKSRLVDLYAIEGIDIADLTARLKDLDARIEVLKSDVPEVPELTLEEALDIFKSAEEYLTGDYDNDQKRVILQSLISRIVLSGDNVEIHWRFE